MKRLLLLLTLLPILGYGQFTVPTYSAGYRGSTGPSVPNIACFTPGNVTSYTTGSVNTTGAKAIVVTSTWAFAITSVVDNLDSTTLTALTPLGSGAGNNVQIFHEVLPSTTGSSATFHFASSTGMEAYICIFPILGITGVYNGDLATATGTTTCQANDSSSSASPSVLIAAMSQTGTGTAAIGSSYTIGGQAPTTGGVNYGGGGAYLVVPSFSGSEPIWSGIAQSACAVASWH